MVGKRELEPENDSQGTSPAKIAESKSEEKATETSPPVTKKARVESTVESKSAKPDSTSTSTSEKSNLEDKESEKDATKKKQDAEKSSQEAQVRHEALSTNAVVIFGLHPLVTKDEMTEVMSKYGKVERIETRRAFASTYCFCDFETAKEAEEAIKNLNGSSLKGKELIVKLANDNASRSKPFNGKQEG
ncbi:unnamed protein product [Cylindrotheca closterium]|uniref:RRM domain-containing protein n=1 Tax=Cylindrotheca closterium TaxID=2856 RepID=A0AAD2FNQ9_9STRA|nr:unnamed protein product [Cylindrotheca closterium]